MKPRKLHRLVVPIAAIPLLITAASGSLYGLLLEKGIDAFWLLKIHTGKFGVLNLQPYYSLLLGLLTLVLIASGLLLLLPRSKKLGKVPTAPPTAFLRPRTAAPRPETLGRGRTPYHDGPPSSQ